MDIVQTKSPEVLARLIQGTHERFHEKYPYYFKPYKYQDAVEYFKEMLTNDRNEFYVLQDLYDGNETAGFIWTNVTIQEETALTETMIILSIKKVVVHPKHRNRGYGQDLLDFVNTLAKRKGCHFIEVELWYIDDDVVNFLTNRGFIVHKGILWKEV